MQPLQAPNQLLYRAPAPMLPFASQGFDTILSDMLVRNQGSCLLAALGRCSCVSCPERGGMACSCPCTSSRRANEHHLIVPPPTPYPTHTPTLPLQQFTSGVNDVELSLDLAGTALNVATGHYFDIYGEAYALQVSELGVVVL